MADHIWTADDVADHFEEAFRTLRKLPPVKARGYFNAWPDIVRTSREIAAMEPQPMRVWPSAASISRLEQTFDWVLWIEEQERKLIWSGCRVCLGSRSAASWGAIVQLRGGGGSWRSPRSPRG